MTNDAQGHGMGSDKTFVTLPDGTVWPDPLDPTDVQWQMRYSGSPGTRACMVAASTIAAYRELVFMPERRRNEIIAALRTAAKAEPNNDAKEGTA